MHTLTCWNYHPHHSKIPNDLSISVFFLLLFSLYLFFSFSLKFCLIIIIQLQPRFFFQTIPCCYICTHQNNHLYKKVYYPNWHPNHENETIRTIPTIAINPIIILLSLKLPSVFNYRISHYPPNPKVAVLVNLYFRVFRQRNRILRTQTDC